MMLLNYFKTIIVSISHYSVHVQWQFRPTLPRQRTQPHAGYHSCSAQVLQCVSGVTSSGFRIVKGINIKYFRD